MKDVDLLLDNAACCSQHPQMLDDGYLRECVRLNVADPLMGEIERLTAERDALLGKTQAWKQVFGDWSGKSQDADWLRIRFLERSVEIDQLLADKERLTAALQKEEENHTKTMREDAQQIERLTAENERLRKLCASAGAALCNDAIAHAEILLTEALEATE